MKSILIPIMLFCIGMLSGCNRNPEYHVVAYILIQSPAGTPHDATVYDVEVTSIMTLASSLIPKNIDLTVEHVPSTEIISIRIELEDSKKAITFCNNLANAYVAQPKEGIIKSISAPAEIIGAKTRY